jgi:hypothetical protein
MLKQTLILFFSPYWKVSRKNRFIRSLFMIPGSIITALLIWKFPIPAYDGIELTLTIILTITTILIVSYEYVRFKREKNNDPHKVN